MKMPTILHGAIRRTRFYAFEFFASAQPRVTEHYHELNEIDRLLEGVRGRLILDLGCGRSRSLSALLAHQGANTVGIDLSYMCAPGSPIWRRVIGSIEAGGPKELVKDLAMALAKEPQIEREIRRILGTQLSQSAKIHLVRGDGRQLPFSDECFDGVVSYDTLEHILNVEDVAREIARVLKPGGLTRHVIDVFSGLLGGHDPYWAIPPRVRPWNHLRAGDEAMVKEAGLNRLRVRDYVNAFSHWLGVEYWTIPCPLAQRHLTNEIREELMNYSEEELLLRKLVVLGKKQSEIGSAEFSRQHGA